jgi:hypothetical protein
LKNIVTGFIACDTMEIQTYEVAVIGKVLQPARESSGLSRGVNVTINFFS